MESNYTISRMLEVFQNRCLLNIFWPNTISNIDIASENVYLIHYDRNQAEKMDT